MLSLSESNDFFSTITKTLQKNKQQFFFITGAAGTGKTTLVKEIAEAFTNEVVLLAPTNIAAVMIGGQTIHSFFGMPFGTFDIKELQDYLEKTGSQNPLDKKFQYIKKCFPLLKKIKAIIIDEVSMVTPNIIDGIDILLKKARRNSDAFGGISCIFSGDLFQLAPVIKDSAQNAYFSSRYNSKYFFSADIFQNINVNCMVLQQVKRQSDSAFIEILHNIRVNENVFQAIEYLNKKCYKIRGDGKQKNTYLVPTNVLAYSKNMKRLNDISTTLVKYEATIENVFSNTPNKTEIITADIPIKNSSGRKVYEQFPAPIILEIKEGARIIFCNNNKPQWINGDIGDVLQLNEDHILVKNLSTDEDVHVYPYKWTRYKYTYNRDIQQLEQQEIGSFTQFPLTLGWALTIHKSQGMTLDNVTIDLGRGAFCQGQTYVALSRCKNSQNIILASPISEHDIKIDPTIKKFYQEHKLT